MSAKHLVHCDNCGAKIREKDRRTGFDPGDRDMPPHEFSGCVLCAASEDDLDRARNAHDDAEFERQRTEDMEVW
jgi:hypothetical protein